MTRKESPVSYDYYLGPEKLLRVQEEKDLGVIICHGADFSFGPSPGELACQRYSGTGSW